MKNKGLILFFTVLLVLVCLYCLSFSFVTWRVEKKAANFANDPAAIEEVKKEANGDVMLEKHLIDSVVEARTRQYLTNMNDSTVYLGNTYKKCKYKELNLGLDLKGGMNVTLEISMPDVVQSLATNTEDPLFKTTFEKSVSEYEKTTGGDFIDIFVKNFNSQKAALKLNNANLRTYLASVPASRTPPTRRLSVSSRKSPAKSWTAPLRFCVPVSTVSVWHSPTSNCCKAAVSSWNFLVSRNPSV